jgi:hypothetical protein
MIIQFFIHFPFPLRQFCYLHTIRPSYSFTISIIDSALQPSFQSKALTSLQKEEACTADEIRQYENDKNWVALFEIAEPDYAVERGYPLEERDEYWAVRAKKEDAVVWFESQYGVPGTVDSRLEGGVENLLRGPASRRAGEMEVVVLTGSLMDSRYATRPPTGQSSTTRDARIEQERLDVSLSHRPRQPPTQQAQLPPPPVAPQQPRPHRQNEPLSNNTLDHARVAGSPPTQPANHRGRGAPRGPRGAPLALVALVSGVAVVVRLVAVDSIASTVLL